MGRKVYVFSSLSNLAQEDVGKHTLTQSAVITGILTEKSKDGLGQFLSSTMLKSQGLKLRQFFNWAKDYYTLGMPSAEIEQVLPIPTADVKAGVLANLSLGSNDTLHILSAYIDNADVDYWVEDWIRDNYPTLTEDQWSAYYDFTFNLIVVQLPNDVTAQVPAPADMQWGMTHPRAEKRLLFVTYRVITQDPVTNDVTQSVPELFTYIPNSGTVSLDALFTGQSALPEFYPAIPLRMDNVSLFDPSQSETYAMANKAFKKLTGSSIEGLVTSVEANENIADIDYAYVVQGVPLNTDNQHGLQYLYKFFENLIPYQAEEQLSQSLYSVAQSQVISDSIQLDRWETANVVTDNPAHPLYGQAVQSYLSSQHTTEPPSAQFRLFSADMPDLDIRMKWNYIRELLKTGNGARFDNNQVRPLLKKGECLLIQGTPENYQLQGWDNGSITWNIESSPKFFLIYQYDTYNYSVLEVVGMSHSNYIYGSHAVHITADEALNDSKESPFLVPLHYPTLKDMGVLSANELSRNCTYLLVNSYHVEVTSWFQDHFGWIITAIAIIVTVFFPPAGVGLLGANFAVGAALGLTGTAAVVAGAVLNMLAAAVVTSLITAAAKLVFGEKLGAIIGAILSFAFIGWNTGSFGSEFNWTDLFKPEHLIRLSNAVSRGYTAALNADTLEIMEELEELETQYSEEMDRLEQLAADVFGVTNNAIDPMIFTDATEQFGESSTAFLSRTLMTGTDIVELSQGIISHFVDISLDLPTDLR